jgi:hypothetical protein
VLFDEFRREVLRRPSRELDPGERVVVRRGEKRQTQDGKRTFRAFRVGFPDQRAPSTSDLLKLDEEPPEKTDEQSAQPAVDDGSVPF